MPSPCTHAWTPGLPFKATNQQFTEQILTCFDCEKQTNIGTSICKKTFELRIVIEKVRIVIKEVRNCKLSRYYNNYSSFIFCQINCIKLVLKTLLGFTVCMDLESEVTQQPNKDLPNNSARCLHYYLSLLQNNWLRLTI